MKSPKKIFSVRLSDKDIAYLSFIAQNEEQTIGDIIRLLIKQHQEKTTKKPTRKTTK